MIVVPAVIGGLVAGRIGVATALLIMAPVIAFWGWRTNMSGFTSRSEAARLRQTLDDDDLRELLLGDPHFRQAILDDPDLEEEILHGANLREVVGADVIRTIVDPPERRNQHTFYGLPVQFWSPLVLLAGILLLTV